MDEPTRSNDTPDDDTANDTADTATRAQGDGLSDQTVALEHAAERLSARFPEVPREDIDRLVGERSEEYEDAPVKDFVPVLVEHDVKAELREGGDRPAEGRVDAAKTGF